MTERPVYLRTETLVYLLGLAARERDRREQSYTSMQSKPGQDDGDYRTARLRKERSVQAAAAIEDQLVAIVGERLPEALRGRHRARLAELTKTT